MRKCGECTACCKLTPVRDLHKPANTRCQHQRMGKGCAIYEKRPHSCALWNCQWLVDPDAGDLSRPDRSHYVIDIVPDFVTITNKETGEAQDILVTQVWVDPRYPEAHRDPALRALLLKRAEENGMAALIRYDEREGFALFPPPLASDGQWHEMRGTGFTREKSLIDMMRDGEIGGKLKMVISEQ